jgi:mortality factor 4-like protein 1
LKITEENVRKQKELGKNQVVDKTVKSGRSTQHKPKGSNGELPPHAMWLLGHMLKQTF